MKSVAAARRSFHQYIPGLQGIRRARMANTNVSPVTQASVCTQKSPMLANQSMRTVPSGCVLAGRGFGKDVQHLPIMMLERPLCSGTPRCLRTGRTARRIEQLLYGAGQKLDIVRVI